jgi:ribosomal protein S27E
MSTVVKCPNCGAQVTTDSDADLSKAICSFCGGSLGGLTSPTGTRGETNDLGYTPDPPPAFDEKPKSETEEKKEVREPIVINGTPMEIPPDVIPTVIQTGRNIKRYAIVVIAALLALCSLCLIISVYRN